MGAAERVAEERKNAVFELSVAEAVAVAALADVEGQHRHVLNAAGEHDIGVAGLDPAGGRVYRFKAGAAKARYVVGRYLYRYARLHRRVAPDVRVLHDLADASENHLVDLVGPDAGALHGCLEDDCGKVRRRGVLECAAHASNGRARAADENNLFHAVSAPPYIVGTRRDQSLSQAPFRGKRR